MFRMQMTTKRLRRSKADAVIGGVAGGLGAYFGIAAFAIRLGWLVFTLAGGAGIVAYLIAWAIIPDQDDRRTLVPVLLLVLGMLLPVAFVLTWLIPVTVTTSH
jgi:phage shock protein C